MANYQNSSGVCVTPIRNLRPGEKNWTIIARVVYKAPISFYSNNYGGSGNFFAFNLLDESGEIRMVAFDNDLDINPLHESLVLNEVYYISDANVKSSNPDYLRVHDYELTVTKDTRFVRIPNLMFNFMPIANIKFPVNNYVDVIGVCINDGELRSVFIKNTGKEKVLRELELIDGNNGRITLTLWGTEAEEYNEPNDPVIVVRNAQVREFNGTTSLSVCSGSMMFVNPPIKEALQLRKWFDNHSATSQPGEPLNDLDQY